MSETFINNSNLDSIVNKTEKDVEYFTSISDKMVTNYTQDLDDLLLRIKTDTIDNEASDNDLELYILELSNMLYFMGQRLENIGIRDDLSAIASKEVYNRSYVENLHKKDGDKKPTVAELNVKAEDDSRYETVLNKIYSRTYKQIKYKIDSSYEMLASLRKILSKRMQEMQMNSSRNTPFVPQGNEVYNV